MDGLLRNIHENLVQLPSHYLAATDLDWLENKNDQQRIRSISTPRYFSDTSSPKDDFAKVANATIPSTHTSATEDLLSSSIAAPFPSLRAQFQPIFLLESNASPFLRQSRSIRPVFTSQEAERLLESFQSNVNFWYPIVARATLNILFAKVQNGFISNTCEDCAALLVMTLGAASELLNLIHSSGQPQGFESRQKQGELMAMAISTIATQCIFLAAFVNLKLPCQNSIRS
jgi:hypothetical protein